MAQEETSKRTPPVRSHVRAGHHGVGQLTLVEHALCPLDAKAALAGTRHECDYFYTDTSRHRRRARVRIDSPAGLSANDEFFLWGLLALTLAQPDASTPRPISACDNWAASQPVPKEEKTTINSDRQSVGYQPFVIRTTDFMTRFVRNTAP